MSSSPHRLFLASAGTGKTYQLTNHYLGLLLRGVAPERILATTFTRKAAGEILDRVLQRLAAAAEGGEGLAELRAALGSAGAFERPGGEALDPQSVDAARCRALLANLARSLDRFQVRTIDAFFVQVAGLFALDLALPPGWTIGEEREDVALRARALQSVLAEAEPGELIELLRGLLTSGDGRSVQDAMMRQIERGRGTYLESTAVAWEWLEVPPRPSPEELERAVAGIEKIEIPLTKGTKTKPGKPNSNWLKAIELLRTRVESNDFEALLDTGLTAKVAAQALDYYGKPITDEMVEVVQPLLDEANARVTEGVAERTRSLRSLLERFEGPYTDSKTKAGRFRFDDLPKLLAGPPTRAADGSGRDPLTERELDLWFRLDGRIDHLLLDEFQDTAPVQWRILEKLADEMLAYGDGERTFFCVGDVKQSIYGWRGGEPRVLGQLAEHYGPRGLEPERLDESWRSARVVLDTVNRVFGGLGESPALLGDERVVERAAAERWAADFQDHVAAKDLPGAVYLLQSRSTEEPSLQPLRLREAVVDRVLRIRAEAPQASVGVLFRSNGPIAALIHALRLEGVPAAGEGGNPLTDSAAVVAFLALLHLADQPEDRAAAFHVGASPFGAALGLGAVWDAEAASKLSRAVRRRLVLEGYGALAAGLAGVVKAAEVWTAWDELRFGQLADLAHAFEDSATLRASDFVDEVRERKIEAPGTGVVRVMTIHASKGLEFDAVVLPELEGKLSGQHQPLWTRREDPYGPIDTVSTALKQERLAACDSLGLLAASVSGRQIEESLSILYVAMTRAARRLDLIVAPPKPSAKVPTGAGLLRAALVPELALSDTEQEEPALELWRHPDSVDDWGAGCGEEQKGTEPEDDELAAEGLRLTPPARIVRARRSSESTAPTARDALASRSAAERGTLVHAWLESLEWVEDFDLDARASAALGERIEPDPARRAEAREALSRALESPAVRTALSRSGADAPDGAVLEVRAEHEFSLLAASASDGEPTTESWTGSIDRLVLVWEGDRVVRADVIDYKTDRVTPSTLTERVEHHRPQLAAYRDAVVVQYGLEPAVVRARLVFLESGDVVDV